jgi:hypothetical protein
MIYIYYYAGAIATMNNGPYFPLRVVNKRYGQTANPLTNVYPFIRDIIETVDC